MSDFALKFVGDSPDTVEGWLAPYNGPDFLGGKDWHGEFFSPSTDFALPWFGDWQRPLLYQHGLDEAIKTDVVGRIKVEARDKGLWMQAQLDAASEYHNEIVALVTAKKLGASSGSVSHLVTKDARTGEIKRWPLIEGSLTPTPSHPDTVGVGYAVKSVDAVLHLGVIGTDAPDEMTEPETPPEPATKAGARHSAADLTHIQSAHDAMCALGATCSTATASKSEAAPVEPEPAAMPVMGFKASEPIANAEQLEAARELLSAYAVKVATDLLR